MRRTLLITAVVLANAVVQALCVIPGLTPAASPGFVSLLAGSVLALVAAATVVVVLVGAPGPLRPRVLRALAAVVVALVVVGALAVASPAAVIPALLVAFVVASPAGNTGATALSGLRALAWHPVRAVLLVLVTLLVIAALAIGALLLGFFVTGGLGAFLTWVAVGGLAALIARAWARLALRPRRGRA